ncbi:hypothetical protein HY480_01060 [Candidatus Uhrbacteria bacterium]|nr:hypothetical protein [Candidatus Uhrbacteria bacterium]
MRRDGGLIEWMQWLLRDLLDACIADQPRIAHAQQRVADGIRSRRMILALNSWLSRVALDVFVTRLGHGVIDADAFRELRECAVKELRLAKELAALERRERELRETVAANNATIAEIAAYFRSIEAEQRTRQQLAFEAECARYRRAARAEARSKRRESFGDGRDKNGIAPHRPSYRSNPELAGITPLDLLVAAEEAGYNVFAAA